MPAATPELDAMVQNHLGLPESFPPEQTWAPLTQRSAALLGQPPDEDVPAEQPHPTPAIDVTDSAPAAAGPQEPAMPPPPEPQEQPQQHDEAQHAQHDEAQQQHEQHAQHDEEQHEQHDVDANKAAADLVAMLFEDGQPLDATATSESLELMLLKEFKKATPAATQPSEEGDEKDGEFDHISKWDRDYKLEEVSQKNFKFLTESAIGRRWVRYLDKQEEKKEKYDKKTRRDKEEERAEWAKVEFDRYKETHKKSKETSHIDRMEGTYMNIDKMIMEEGGSNSRVVRGCVNYAIKCIKKGGKWVMFNDMTERLEFRNVKRKRIEDRATRWTVGSGGGNNPHPAPTASRPLPSRVPTAPRPIPGTHAPWGRGEGTRETQRAPTKGAQGGSAGPDKGAHLRSSSTCSPHPPHPHQPTATHREDNGGGGRLGSRGRGLHCTLKVDKEGGGSGSGGPDGGDDRGGKRQKADEGRRRGGGGGGG